MKLALILVVSSAIFATLPISMSSPLFSDAEIFERLSHFKDAGVPGTVNDIVNQAMIADGTCRLFLEHNGYEFWHSRQAVTEVIDAIKNLPDTSHPSHLVLTAHEVLPKVCSAQRSANKIGNTDYTCSSGSYDLMVMAQSMNNWQRAICADKDDSAWNNLYDPAYQPQQIALTSGFMCILACDCNEKKNLNVSTFTSIASDPQSAKKKVCELAPWRGTNFTTAGSNLQLFAKLSSPLLEGLCECN